MAISRTGWVDRERRRPTTRSEKLQAVGETLPAGSVVTGFWPFAYGVGDGRNPLDAVVYDVILVVLAGLLV